INEIERLSRSVPEKREGLMRFCFERCSEELDQSLVHRHGRHKPLGYPGDYLIMDYIYTNKEDSSGSGQVWDRFFHRQQAPRAVRNRMNYFIKAARDLAVGKTRRSILNVAAGPCRELAEIGREDNDFSRCVSIHCVDADAKAIAYARALLSGLP